MICIYPIIMSPWANIEYETNSEQYQLLNGQCTRDGMREYSWYANEYGSSQTRLYSLLIPLRV